MSSCTVRTLMERLASDRSLQKRFRVDREAVLANISLDAEERDAFNEMDADELLASFNAAALHSLSPSRGIANPGIANPGMTNPG